MMVKVNAIVIFNSQAAYLHYIDNITMWEENDCGGENLLFFPKPFSKNNITVS
jgi:hypothetical protein